MSHEEKVQLVKRLFWDYKVDPELVIQALDTDSEKIGGLHINTLFIKLLNYYPWHLVREIVPERALPKLLSDEVIDGLFPPVLRERYKYVRKLL